jgi:hypothetical protein
MTWFEDDSKGISEEVMNMPIEKIKANLREYEEECRQKRLAQNQPRQAYRQA